MYSDKTNEIGKNVNIESHTNKTSIDNTVEVKTRFVYNSKVMRKNIEGLLAKPNKLYYMHKNRKQVHVPEKMNAKGVDEYLHGTRVVRSTNHSNPQSLSHLSNSSKKCNLAPTKGVNMTTLPASPTLARDNRRVKQDGHELTRPFVVTENNSHLVTRREAHRRVNCVSANGQLCVDVDKRHSNPVGDNNSHSRVNDNKSARVFKAHTNKGLSPTAENATSNCNSQGVGETEAPSTMRALSYTRLYDINNASSDKYINTLVFRGLQKITKACDTEECSAFKKWKAQTDFDFGFVPLADFIMPQQTTVSSDVSDCPITQHFLISQTQVPNFLGARIPIQSQLNVQKWHEYLSEYWDQQLLQLVTFGFPLDFNRQCVLKAAKTNHASAVRYPADIQTYLTEEKQYKAILGPFKQNPIQNCHYSPFMTRDKPGSESRRVIIDLSWPPENSVNAGIHKDSYLGTDFSLTFPTVDHITDALKKIGRGAHLFKIDINRAFRHVKIDPLDYDLLGLFWEESYIDTCLPFGTRHGTQIFQRLSDSIRYILKTRGFPIINYVDDFVGFGTPSEAKLAFDQLYEIVQDLGLTISQKKLVPPSTKATCLGVVIDTKEGTVSIPPEKIAHINESILLWQAKTTCTRKQLQSLLGHLLYIHKCVKPSRFFVNRMLQLLRNEYDSETITLTGDFHRDLRWFTKFMAVYNGISLYDHKPIAHTIELDACLTGLGGRCDQWVYHLSIPKGFQQLTIVHLEMINILLAVKLFGNAWSRKRVLIKCDNNAVVNVLRSGRARDPFLCACARNIWLQAAKHDVDLSYIHVLGKKNVVADRLSRWTNSIKDWGVLLQYVRNPIWLTAHTDMLNIDNEI